MRTGFLFAAALFCWSPAPAQQTVAPTPERTGRPRGEDAGGYNIVQWFELGARFHDVEGSQNRYRSDINYGNGIRLLQSHLTVHSKDGHGRLFDEIVLTTQGLGNDPYESASLRIQRNKLYQYNLQWRFMDYVNPGLTGGAVAGHLVNTRRTMQDHDLVVLPDSPIRLLAGYSRNGQQGPALSSIQLFDARGDEFPLFAPVDRQQTELRLGVMVQAGRSRITLLRGWQRFEEVADMQASAEPGANLADTTTLQRFSRREPFQGDSPFWRILLHHEPGGTFAATGRFSYSGGRRDFLMEESATGTGRFSAAQDRQLMVSGSGRRPVTHAALTLSYFPTGKLTIANHAGFYQIQMDGGASFRQVNNSGQAFTSVQFQQLAIRDFSNATDAQYRLQPWAGLRAGYRFSHRRIRSLTGVTELGATDAVRHQQENRLHSSVAGARFQPAKPLSLMFDGEIGRVDRPFLALSEKRYHLLSARIQYRNNKGLMLAASTRANYNFNSDSLFHHSSRSRDFTLDASWSGRGGIGFDAGYARLHLDTLTGLAYFASLELVRDRSLYISNIHALHTTVRIALAGRADLFAGYSRTQDTGRTFPLTYDAPQARMSIRIHDKLRLNFGYQRYRYEERMLLAVNYRAHTGYTSLLWSF
jgi:hypothetical protein